MSDRAAAPASSLVDGVPMSALVAEARGPDGP